MNSDWKCFLPGFWSETLFLYFYFVPYMGQEGEGLEGRAASGYPGSFVPSSGMKGSPMSRHPPSVSDGTPLPWMSVFISQNMGLLVKQV